MADRQRYHLPAIAGFRRQLRFASRGALRKQALAAEALLFEVARDRVYPSSWVVWRITGFRPEAGQLADSVLDGAELRHDLAVFLQELAGEVDFQADDRPDGAVDTAEAASRLGVTVRTLQRWRNHGLPLIPIRFQDGRRRRGCFLDTLERFAAVEAPLVSRARRFGRVKPAEQREIEAKVASRLADGDPRTVAANEVAAEVGRSGGAVRRAAQLDGGRVRLPREVDRLLLRAHDWRVPEARLAGRLQRSPATLRRILLRARKDRVLALRPYVVDLPTASLPGAEEVFASAGELDDVPERLLGLEATAWLAAVREIGEQENSEVVGNRIAAMHFVHGRAAVALDALPMSPGVRSLDPVERDLAWGARLLERTVIGAMYAAVRRYEQSVQVRMDARPSGELVPIIEALCSRTADVVRGFDPARGGVVDRLGRAVGL